MAFVIVVPSGCFIFTRFRHELESAGCWCARDVVLVLGFSAALLGTMIALSFRLYSYSLTSETAAIRADFGRQSADFMLILQGSLQRLFQSTWCYLEPMKPYFPETSSQFECKVL
jgi:hypothetical protein